MTDSIRDTHTSPSSATPRAFPAIFVGGFIVGIIDLAYAILVYSPKHPIRIGQAVASGLLGPKSFNGGMPTSALGVLLHFTIALGAATVFYLASRHMRFLLERAVIYGLIYGALVYGFMHLVVIPLSLVRPGHPALIYQVCEFVEHWFGVGLPISLSVKHYAG
jgi:hypothetical protein